MAALSLILALSALWTGPIWGQDRSWAGSIDPVRVSALWLPLREVYTSFYQTHKPRLLWQDVQLEFGPPLHPMVLNVTQSGPPHPWPRGLHASRSGLSASDAPHASGPWPPWSSNGTRSPYMRLVGTSGPSSGENAWEPNISRIADVISLRADAISASERLGTTLRNLSNQPGQAPNPHTTGTWLPDQATQ